jgi:hypothetical protein
MGHVNFGQRDRGDGLMSDPHSTSLPDYFVTFALTLFHKFFGREKAIYVV